MESVGLVLLFLFGPAWLLAEELMFRRIKVRHLEVWEKLGRPQVWSLAFTRPQRKLRKLLDDAEALESLDDRLLLMLDSVRTISRFLALLGVFALIAQKLGGKAGF